VNKKVILVTAVAGVVSFAGAFLAGWGTTPAPVQGEPATPAPETETQPDGPPKILSPSLASGEDNSGTRSMTEQQLKELIYEVREKIKTYDEKLDNLEKEKSRLFVAQQTLQKDIETLNNLRVDLAAAAANAKSERDLLFKTRVEVEKVERGNLLAIAAAYDKMDAARASEILTNMAMTQTTNGTTRTSNIDDAVKILYFMQERTKAKVLAELVSLEPKLAAVLCQKLKQVTEEE